MVSFALRKVAFCVLLTAGCLPLVSQSPNYHVALEGNPPCAESTNNEPQTTDSHLCPEGADPLGCPSLVKRRKCQSPSLALVNDSDKSIEAFAASERCIPGKVAQAELQDVLIDGATGMEPDGEGVLPSSLAPGARWLMFGVAYECDQKIDAVLFTDGSFEGSDDGLRALKARRDGVATSVNYWAYKLRQERPDGSTLGTLMSNAKDRVAEDAAELIKHSDPTSENDLGTPLWDYVRLYWEGRQKVDGGAQWWARGASTKEPAWLTFQRFADQIYRSKKEIDDDLVQKKLNSVFPQISEPTASNNDAQTVP